jgi:secreted trypsin-like serine protease
MRKIVLLLAIVILLKSAPISAVAIENGTDATGSSFVVPITFELSPNNWAGCSGALIAPQIVITAAHCAVDLNGLINKKIYVGDPGARSDSIKTSDIIKEVKMTSSYQSGTYVTADDIAFLILSKPKTLAVKIELASEAEVLALSASKSQLKIFGYGSTSNLDTSSFTSANSGTGTFSSIGLISKQPDSAIYMPIKGNSCAGDSGGPVMSITASKVTVVGIITGSNRTGTNMCGGTYTVFTLVNRYTNLAFAIASSLMETSLAESKAKEAELIKEIEDLKIESKKLTDAGYSLSASFNSLKEQYDLLLAANNGLLTKYDETVASANSKITEVNALNVDAWSKNKLLKEENASLTTQISTYQVQISSLEGEIESLKVQIDELNAKLPKTITCVKGSSTKKVTAVKPKCPSGYKLKVA